MSKRKKEAWMRIFTMAKGKGVIKKIVAEQQKLFFFQGRKEILIMQLLYVNQLVSALEKIDRLKRFPFILSFCRQVFCSIENYYCITLTNFYTCVFVIEDTLLEF